MSVDDGIQNLNDDRMRRSFKSVVEHWGCGGEKDERVSWMYTGARWFAILGCGMSFDEISQIENEVKNEMVVKKSNAFFENGVLINNDDYL